VADPSQFQVGSFQDRTSNLLETLTNLVYLTKVEAEKPDNVREYMTLADGSLRLLVSILQSTLWAQANPN
jgi:hypothetical protein